MTNTSMMKTEALAIDTERLTMRIHRIDDFAESAAMWADPEVTRHIGGRPFTEEEVWARLMRYVGHWTLLGYGYWVVRDKATGRFVGEVGFADFRREIDPPFAGAPEIGWVLATWSHGKGFATEAVRAATAWATLQLEGRRTVCLIDTTNTRSIRVAQKCGYEEYARTTYKGTPVILFERGRTT